jgi:dolichol kinase
MKMQASVVGKRMGRYKWSPTTPKTLEGSASFTTSIVAFAWALRVCGLVEEFSVSLTYVDQWRHLLTYSVRLCDTG